MSVRASLLTALVLLLPLAAGCGSESATGPAGAEIAPASAELFISVATDFDSDEWAQAANVLAKFPDAEKALDMLLTEAGLEDFEVRRDLEPALGPETDLVAWDLAGESQAVGLTQAEDPEKLGEILAKLEEELVTREIGGWTAFSDSEAALDQFESARAEGTLASSAQYEETMSRVDRGALVQLYLNGKGLDAPFPGADVPSLGLSFGAEEGGVRLEGVVEIGDDGRGILPGENFAAELPERVPGGVLLYVGANNLEQGLSSLRDLLAETMPDFDRDLARVEHELGVSLDEDVFPLFSEETAVYVRSGLFIPEITLVTEVTDEDAAMSTLGKLVSALGEYVPAAQDTRDVEIAGVQAKEIPLSPPVGLYYAAFEGLLVVTTSADGIAAVRKEDDRLADDPDFRDALDAAGVPDETTGFAYVNLEDAIPYVLGFVEQGADTVPPVVRSNLEPLRRLVVYGEKDGTRVRFAGFLAVD